ncbi:MAG: hypothetical protein RL755_6 [Pseudomonadota bacterium]|jgi:hypothetical protein
MAAKSIIDIEVNDEKFKSFLSAFDDYKANVEDMPEAWKNTNKAINEADKAAKRLSSGGLSNEEKKAASEAKKFADEQKKASTHMGTMLKATKQTTQGLKEGARHTASIATGIMSATANLMKWGGILAGVTTGAGMFGFNRLIDSASNARFTSQGLGVGAGAVTAANVNYSSIVANPAQMLASIRDVQSDITKQRVLSAAGISNYQNKNAAEIAPDLIRYAQQQAKGSKGHVSQMAQATGLDQIFSLDELNRLANTTEKETEAMIAKARADEKALALGDSTLKSYQDLNKQIDRFGETIKKSAIESLEKLAPNLEKLSKSALNAFDKLMKSDKLPPLIDKLADGIGDFADYLTSDKFKTDFDNFTKGVGDATTAIAAFGVFLGKITPEDAKLAALGVGGAMVAGSMVTGGGALPVLAAGAAGYYGGSTLYGNASADTQQGIQDFVGKTAAFFGNKDAQDAMAVNSGNTDTSMNHSQREMMSNVYEAYRKAGLSDKQARVMTAEVGRENDFNESVMFGTHIDPHNQKVNLGMISMQGDRGTNLAKYMTERGLMKNGQMEHSQEAIDAMAAFQMQEMKSGDFKMDEFLANKDISYQEGSALAGRNYVKWRYDDPRYAAHHLKEAGYYEKMGGVVGSQRQSSNNPPPIVIPRGEKDVKGQLRDVLYRPQPEQAKSIMFQQNQGGNVGGMRLLIENNTGGNTITSAASL